MKKLVIFSLFISAGINASDWDNARAAILRPDFKALQNLLNNDPNIINQCGPGGTTLLHIAMNSRPDDLALAEFLLMRGIDVNRQDVNGYTALMDAVEFGNDAMVELLLRQGADIDIRNGMGKQALTITPGERRSFGNADPQVINIKRLLKEAKLKKDKEAQEKKEAPAKKPKAKTARRSKS